MLPVNRRAVRCQHFLVMAAFSQILNRIDNNQAS